MRFLPMFRRTRERTARLVVAVDAAKRAGVGWVIGDLTLPVPTVWGEFLLPAGYCEFMVPSWSRLGVVYLERPGHDALVLAKSVEERPSIRTSEVVLVRRGSRFSASSLALRDPGIVLHFDLAIPASDTEVPLRSASPFATTASAVEAILETSLDTNV